jgi:predicted RNase H-like nuclease (RuvC/YqgF family)
MPQPDQATSSDLKAQNEKLRLENEDLRFDLNRLRASTEQQQQQIFELHGRLEESFQLRVDGDSEREIERLRAKEQLLKEIFASRSWQLTRAYRFVGRLIKK